MPLWHLPTFLFLGLEAEVDCLPDVLQRLFSGLTLAHTPRDYRTVNYDPAIFSRPEHYR